jgi:hypothetical protein
MIQTIKTATANTPGAGEAVIDDSWLSVSLK